MFTVRVQNWSKNQTRQIRLLRTASVACDFRPLRDTSGTTVFSTSVFSMASLGVTKLSGTVAVKKIFKNNSTLANNVKIRNSD